MYILHDVTVNLDDNYRDCKHVVSCVNFLTCVDTEVLFSIVALRQFSQGSVAIHSRCGWNFSDSINKNFIRILTVKKFENWTYFVPSFGPSCRSFRLCSWIDGKGGDPNWKSMRRDKGRVKNGKDSLDFRRWIRLCI